MNIIAISLRNLRVRVVSTSLTTLSILVGTTLLASLWLLIGETEQRYRASASGFRAIVGPKEGSPLALVLNTVYNLGTSPGIVPLSVYNELHARRDLRYAIPQGRGDTYRGFPVIGTTDEMFSKFRRGDSGELRMAQGRPFNFSHDEFVQFAADLAAGKVQPAVHDHEHAPGEVHYHPHPHREAVIGSQVARRADMGLGSLIAPVHGSGNEPDAHVHEESVCEVVGVMEATGSPIDDCIFIPLATFLTMDKHDAIRPGQEASADNVALTAVICEVYRRLGEQHLRYEFRGRRDAQIAVTWTEITDLLKMVGNATDVLRVVSYLVLLVAGVSVLVALYNTMNERRREIAIMRALGARRGQILRIIVQEAALIAGVGAVLGVGACHGLAYLLSDVVRAQTGVGVDWAAFSWDELWLILGVIALGAVAGVLPAVKAARTQVADNLAPTS